MKRSSRARGTSELSEPINRQLNMYAVSAKLADVSGRALIQPAGPRILSYALAISAAGLAGLASVPSAHAKIVYTPAHVKLPNNYYDKKYYLDLNHDGQDDFVFFASRTCHSGCTYDVSVGRAGEGNDVIATNHGYFPNAVALRRGAQIRPARQVRQFYGGGLLARAVVSTSGKETWFGQWANGGKGLKNRYLGLQFEIKGKTHYGWVRVTVDTSGGPDFIGTLTGYAYETVPGKPIIAGKTKGPDVEEQPATLGRLALGRKSTFR